MQTPIRIAQIMGKWHGGGVESVVLNYYKNIDRKKIQFDFICDSDSTSIPYDEIKKLGGKVILVPPYQHIFKYKKELKKVLKENDYNIVHSHISSLSIFPLKVAKKLNIPVRIAHSHTTSNRKEIKKNIIKKILRLFSKKYANYYFACSNKAAKWLFGNKTDVEIINNAIDYDKFKYNLDTRKKLREKHNIADDTLVIGHIGRFVQVKNHEYIIDIFNEVHKENKNTLLVLAGKGPLLDKVKVKVKKLGLDKNVLFLGQIDNPNDIYQLMDVFILPSLYEGLPVVGIEAQVAKLPCIFSNEITKDVKIANNTKFIGISKKDISLWKDEILKIKNKKNTSNNLSDSYNIKTQVKNLENKYLELYKNNKKVVMHLISTSVFSGLENVACQIINNFKDDNYEMIYTSVIDQNKKSLDERNIKYYDLKKFNYFNVRKAVKELNPSIIHAHDTKAIVLASLFYKNKTIIGHIHGNHLNLRKLTPKSLLLKIVSKRLKRIVWVSDSSLDNYRYLDNVKEKSIILYNVIDVNEIKEKIKKDKNSYSKYDLVYLGRLSREKDPLKLIEIINLTVKEKSNLKVAIIGTGQLESDVKDKIREYNLEKNIDMYGFISNPYKILASSKIMIMTSIYEGTPMCALEAISLGKPIITTPVDGMLKIVTNNKTGYIVKKNIDFKDSILSLINNPNKYKEFSKNQLENSKKINNIENYIKEIKKIYRG